MIFLAMNTGMGSCPKVFWRGPPTESTIYTQYSTVFAPLFYPTNIPGGLQSLKTCEWPFMNLQFLQHKSDANTGPKKNLIPIFQSNSLDSIDDYKQLCSCTCPHWPIQFKLPVLFHSEGVFCHPLLLLVSCRFVNMILSWMFQFVW